MEHDIFKEENQIKSNWIKFGMVGDFIVGTLISVREKASNMPNKQGKMEPCYEFKVRRFDGGFGGRLHQK